MASRVGSMWSEEKLKVQSGFWPTSDRVTTAREEVV
jgi:hypothetical protein